MKPTTPNGAVGALLDMLINDVKSNLVQPKPVPNTNMFAVRPWRELDCAIITRNDVTFWLNPETQVLVQADCVPTPHADRVHLLWCLVSPDFAHALAALELVLPEPEPEPDVPPGTLRLIKNRDP